MGYESEIRDIPGIWRILGSWDIYEWREQVGARRSHVIVAQILWHVFFAIVIGNFFVPEEHLPGLVNIKKTMDNHQFLRVYQL